MEYGGTLNFPRYCGARSLQCRMEFMHCFGLVVRNKGEAKGPGLLDVSDSEPFDTADTALPPGFVVWWSPAYHHCEQPLQDDLEKG